MAKKTKKGLGKNFLNPLQVATLKDLDYTVKKNGFHVTFESHEFKYNVWEELCEIAGADPDSDKITLVCFGFVQKE
jgi:hypothetical protein